MASYTGYTTVPSDNVRFRTAADGWVPSYVGFESGFDQSMGQTVPTAWMGFWFVWNGSSLTMTDVHKPQQAFELHAEVDCAWADNIQATWATPGEIDGYRSDGWVTNIPNAALPYEDTIFKEQCQTDFSVINPDPSVPPLPAHQGRGKFGIGVLNASALVRGTMYYAKYAITRDTSTPPPVYNSSATITASANISFDSKDNVYGTIPELNGNCNFTDAQIATWNNPTPGDLANRETASWCSWADFQYEIADTFTGDGADGSGYPFDYWLTNNLTYMHTNPANPHSDASSMEYGGVLPEHWLDDSGNSFKVCGDSFHPAYDGSCYVRLPGGTTPGYYSQLRSDLSSANNSGGAAPGFRPSGEIAVRCHTGASCGLALAVIMGPNDATSEIMSQTYTIPNSGSWYICRVDKEHGAYKTAQFHSNSSLEINNFGSSDIDIDFGFLGRDAYKKEVRANDPLGNPHPNDLPNVATPPGCLIQGTPA